MPWADKVQGIVETFYPGIGGAQSLASILFGDVNPSGRLAISFAKSDDQLPHPQVPGIHVDGPGSLPEARHHQQEVPFDADYTKEGARVGYKWFESEHKTPLFPFGFGLSYTTYEFSGLNVDPAQHTATFTVRNTGDRAGTEVAQVYAILPASTGESTYKRLTGWDRVALERWRIQNRHRHHEPAHALGLRRGQERLHPNPWRLPDPGRRLLRRHSAHRQHARKPVASGSEETGCPILFVPIFGTNRVGESGQDKRLRS